MNKKIIFLLFTIVLTCMLMKQVSAQSGFSEGSYYASSYSISDIAVGFPYPKYFYGQYAGTYQLMKRARWHNSFGGEYVYCWSGGQWSYVWRQGYYYWFDWITYEIRLQ